MKNFILILMVVIITLCNGNLLAQDKGAPLDYELERLNIESALIVNSQGVDEYPLWSKDGNTLAANIMGQWFTVNLKDLVLAEAKWRKGKKLGVLNSGFSVSKVESTEILPWKAHNREPTRFFKSKKETQISLKQNGFSTVFTIQIRGGQEEIIWTSDSENCHSIVPSPDEKFITFICEMNGVLVYKIE
ncbi:MAG: hypothetical protein GY705_29650 [Bacteroidetes bacterium]|nr:hypothetical protein [Bacteroidota bacterium]